MALAQETVGGDHCEVKKIAASGEAMKTAANDEATEIAATVVVVVDSPRQP